MLKDTMQKIGKIITGGYDGRKEPTPPNIEGVEDIRETKEEIVDFITKEFERRKRDRRPFELQWRLNANFLQGNQYCDISPDAQDVWTPPQVRDWEIREVYNHIAPIVQTRLSKLNRVQPQGRVRPATSDMEDVATAKTSTKLLRAAHSKLDMSGIIRKTTQFSELCGTSFYKSVWDVEAGNMIGTIDGEEVYEGDIKCIACPPYEIFPDNNFVSMEECRSIIHAKAYDVDDIKSIWGVDVDGNTVDVFTMDNSGSTAGGFGFNASVPTISRASKDNAAVVIEHYERPTKRYPTGRHIVVAGDKLLRYAVLPYFNGEDYKRDLPFTRQVCEENPGCFWGQSVIERMIPVQRAYNAVINRIHEFLNRDVSGVLIYEQGSIADETPLDEGLPPGSRVELKPGKTTMAPKWMESNRIPTELLNEAQRLEQEFTLISGVSEIARNSNTPTGTNSGTALEILKEQDDTRLALVAENIRSAVLGSAKQWLRLYKQFATAKRIDRCVGDNGRISAILWSSADITSCDIVFETENELINTPAQRKQMVADLINLGVFHDENGMLTNRAKAKIVQTYQLGDWEDVTGDEDMHINRALEENDELLNKNELPEIMEIDDHDAHAREHIRFALSGDFKELRQENPDIAEQFMAHIKEHQTMSTGNAAAMNKQLQQQNGQLNDSMAQIENQLLGANAQ